MANFIDENGNLIEIEKTFSYHGVELAAVKNGENRVEVFEPAYGTKLDVGSYEKRLAYEDDGERIRRNLDRISGTKNSCEMEKNFLPEIAFSVIRDDKKAMNRAFNRTFVEKVEALRQAVKAKVKKGMVLGMAFAVCACAMPKLSAESYDIGMDGSIQPTIISMSQFSTEEDYYRHCAFVKVVDVDSVKKSLEKDALELFKEDYPKLKEGTKKYVKTLKENFPEYVKYVAEGEETDLPGVKRPYYWKFAPSLGSIMDLDNGKALLLGNHCLITSGAKEYIENVKSGKIQQNIEVSQDKTAKRDVSSYERGA